MSNVYNLEPPTKGKVSLRTTLGDLDIELWPKEAPKAVRNFVQLCLEGYYDGCIFHRVIKDFMAQTGDPTGTGEGGETIYGAPFRDEFHSRLRFSHRGLIACANANEKHTNGSQFFVTLDKCDWLNNKNTIFGKIVGDTIYNMLRFNDLEVDEATDRPIDPPIIKSVEVLWNPFDDIVPRTTPQERQAQEQFKRAEASRKERKGRKRNLALLSFGEQAEEEEQDLMARGAAARIKSAHEVLRDDSKLLAPEETPEEVLREREQRTAALAAVQGKLKAAGDAGRSGRGRDSSSDSDSDSDSGSERGRKRRRGAAPEPGKGAAALVAERVKAATDRAERANAGREGREAAVAAAVKAASEAGAAGAAEGRDRDRSRSRSRSRSGSRERQPSREAAAAAPPGGRADDLYSLKEKSGAGRLRVTDDVADGELLKSFELSRQKYKRRKEQVGNRQKDTLAKLQAFTAKLRASTQTQQQDRAAAAAKAGEQEQQPQQPLQQLPGQQEEAAAAAATEQQQQPPAAQAGEAAEAVNGAGGQGGDAAYDGKVRQDIDHRSYMPAAWRVDEYLNQEEDEEDFDLSSLKQHKLEFSKAPGQDAMARRDDIDDYVVFDPLLEAAKGKFSRAAQREKKKQTTWAGKGQG